MKLPVLSDNRSSGQTGHQEDFGSIRAVIDYYTQNHRPLAMNALLFFKRQPNLNEAITYATLSVLPNGKRHRHQWRIPKSSLELARDQLLLLSLDLSLCENFAQLHTMVEHATKSIYRIGELVTYDISLRIGAFLDLEPELVYLHCGTRKGARVFGLGHGRATLAVAELPKEFSRLKPREIEDCLCVFKEQLRALIAK